MCEVWFFWYFKESENISKDDPFLFFFLKYGFQSSFLQCSLLRAPKKTKLLCNSDLMGSNMMKIVH